MGQPFQKTAVGVPDSVEQALGRKATWSDVIRFGNHVFLTGQVGWDKTTGSLVGGGFAEQTWKTLENIRDLLHSVGATLDDLVLMRTYLTSSEQYDEFDQIFSEFFRETPKPCRITVVVASLVDVGSLIDIEAQAFAPIEASE